jgi:hypothetical protein
MKKPAWISFFGWAGLFMVGIATAGAVLEAVNGYDHSLSLIVGASAFCSWPCFLLWGVASFRNALNRSKAKYQAEAMSQAWQQFQSQHPGQGPASPPGVASILEGIPGPGAPVQPRRKGHVMTSPLDLTGTEDK